VVIEAMDSKERVALVTSAARYPHATHAKRLKIR